MPGSARSPVTNNPRSPQRDMPRPESVTYFASDKTLHVDLLDQEAENWGKKLDQVRPTQLRRFYEHVLALRRRLHLETVGRSPREKENAFSRLRAEFKMLKAKAAYSHRRDPENFPKVCLQFFVNHTAAVKTAADFEAFCKHFQAVVAFHKFYARKDN